MRLDPHWTPKRGIWAVNTFLDLLFCVFFFCFFFFFEHGKTERGVHPNGPKAVLLMVCG
jgi:hypothetical protein